MRFKSPGGSMTTALPGDLLVHILDRISDPADRKAWRLVCREFLRVDYQQRKSLKLLRHGYLPAILRRYGSLERLDLSACSQIDDGAIRSAFSRIRLGNLKSINLSRRRALRWRGLGFVVSACPALETVDLSFCSEVGDLEMAVLAKAPHLRELDVTKCLGVTDFGLARVAVGCSDLERLSLKWCLEISDIGIDLLVKKCGSLKDLDISYLRVTNASLRSISSLEKLESLSMVSCSLIDDAGFLYLANVSSSLVSINCARCENVTSAGLSLIIKPHSQLQKINAGHCLPDLSPMFLTKLKHLENSLVSIKLDRFNLSSSALRTIGIHCKNLVEIGLGKCEGITDNCISEISSNCPHLRTVDLTCCHLISDSSLVYLARYCRNLRCLRLESCTGITAKGLSQIGDSCPNLSEIDLTDCGICDDALKCLSKCTNLIELKLGLCPRITNEGLTHIASNLKNLQELDLYRCSGVGDEGVAAISRGCKKMRRLNVCYCGKITDDGMKCLGGLERLMELEMRELVRVTGVGVAAVAAGCRSLVKLDAKMCKLVDDGGFLALARHSENLRQTNISHCRISDGALCVLLGSLSGLQDVKLIHLPEVSAGGFELALRAGWEHLQKLKLPIHLRPLLSNELLQMLQARCCRIRWVNKPLPNQYLCISCGSSALPPRFSTRLKDLEEEYQSHIEATGSPKKVDGEGRGLWGDNGGT